MVAGDVKTIAAVLHWGRSYLRAAGVEEPARTAAILLGHVLDHDTGWVYAHPEEMLDEEHLFAFHRVVKKRAQRVPVQYITGCQEFMSLEFLVCPGVFIPRPETEILVEWVLKVSRSLRPKVCKGGGQETGDPLIVADIGTGSGVVAVSVAYYVPWCRVYATDISTRALKVAAENAARNGVAGRVSFWQGDLFQPLDENGLAGQVDIIATNPPYVSTAEYRDLEPEVRRWEPAEALLAGPRGLDFYPRLAGEAPRYLKPGGYLGLEVGYNQAGAVTAMLQSDGRYTAIEVWRDYAGRDRVVTARCRGRG